MPGSSQNSSSLPHARDVRFIGAVMGRYGLASRDDREPGRLRVFACRLQSISPHTFVVSAPVLGGIGEVLHVHFAPFGAIRGAIARHIDGGFVVTVEGSAEERGKLASRISWYKKHTFSGVADKREHRRVMPRDPRSSLVLADGTLRECLIIDMSSSGAAVSADLDPEINLPLALGRTVGRVVRRLDVGFAVRFLTPQPAETLEDVLHLQQVCIPNAASG